MFKKTLSGYGLPLTELERFINCIIGSRGRNRANALRHPATSRHQSHYDRLLASLWDIYSSTVTYSLNQRHKLSR